ncbi:MAG: hypothetical protein HYW05_02145 [Candidatus Diapherotrites archaeon]|nr:hypothetical protein [Candidatus Diapherotrites archaeon]
MHNARALEEFAKNRLRGIPVLGFACILRVRRNAEIISEGMDFDGKILHAAIYLHNLGMEQALKYNQDAIATSMALAKKLMLNNNFTQSEIDRVLHCISEAHLNGKPKTAEAKILHDAKMLDECGASGILNDCYALAQRKKTSPQIASHFASKASLLKGAFFTQSGKELSGGSIALYVEFAKSLEKEIL